MKNISRFMLAALGLGALVMPARAASNSEKTDAVRRPSRARASEPSATRTQTALPRMLQFVAGSIETEQTQSPLASPHRPPDRPPEPPGRDNPPNPPGPPPRG